MYIYKKIIDDEDGINDKVLSNFVFKTINKGTKSLSLEVTFTDLHDCLNMNKTCYRHYIELEVDGDSVSIKRNEI